MPIPGPKARYVNANGANLGKSQVDLREADLPSVYKARYTSPQGLTQSEAETRLNRCGPNSIQEKEQSALLKFLRFMAGGGIP
ncbi:cation-transporting P-type ATPase [Microbulbifer variabilis]|uniref:cation-transporting P-type ATPase n=1 Tax=Microbulbifer variabilis TaxID=266805 RepID=UPI001CFC526F|nr:cation-transporting P-type ATPase [Microbulbifer variabilis]